MEYGMIMAGGSGTRLWPLSRGDRPKQLLPVVHGKSLLRLAYERLRAVLPPERIFVCTLARHAEAVRQSLPELPAGNLLGEPEGRDTLNAIGYTAAVLQKRDKDAVMAVVTADHVIEPVEVFGQTLKNAFAVVAQAPQALVTFGIVPTHGDPGLGYVHRGDDLPIPGVPGVDKVQRFVEKPKKDSADKFVDSGRYYWNSGMFVWRADTFLAEVARYKPQAHQGLVRIASAWDTPRRQEVLGEIYPTLERISVDFAILEPASQGKGPAKVLVMEMPLTKWLDVGSWPKLAETLDTVDDNAVDCDTCVFMDASENIVVSEVKDHLIALVGLDDMIVVHTPDATLVCPRSEAQNVKKLVEKIREKYGKKYE